MKELTLFLSSSPDSQKVSVLLSVRLGTMAWREDTETSTCHTGQICLGRRLNEEYLGGEVRPHLHPSLCLSKPGRAVLGVYFSLP